MKTKFLYLILLSIILLFIWLNWSSVPLQNKFIVYNRSIFPNYHFIQGVSIQPRIGKCLDNWHTVIIVTSYVGHVELRSAHRRSMPQEHLAQYNTTRVFLLAKIPLNEKYIKQEAINDESNTFGDILQGSFLENYRNLTYKHLMGLHWASTYCNNSKFILKVDDDTVFSFKGTHKMLSALNNFDKNNFLMGYMLNNTLPRRNKVNKWYVSWGEYGYNYYPPYLSGWYYVTTPQVAGKLCKAALNHPNFWIDDILITGILTEALEIKLKQLPLNFWLEYYELLECCLRDMIVKKMKCPYIVGPNGGRSNLIYEFNDALSVCEHRNCTERSANRTLKNDCVAFKYRAIFSDGQPKVEMVKL